MVMCLFIINKIKENQKKINIKSRKIDERKRKMLVFKHIIRLYSFYEHLDPNYIGL